MERKCAQRNSSVTANLNEIPVQTLFIQTGNSNNGDSPAQGGTGI
jgi:hypothetical protein